MGLKFNLRLEIDLEYPCPEGFKNCGNGLIPSNHDKQSYVQLIQKFREKLEGKHLAIATNANSHLIERLDFKYLNQLVDWYNIMTYDFTSGSWDKTFTGFHSKS